MNIIHGDNLQRSSGNDGLKWFINVSKVAVGKINSIANECNFDFSASAFDPRIFPVTDQFNFMHVDCNEVAQIVRSMPANQESSGIDTIPVRVIKDSLNSCYSPGDYILN